MAASRDPQKLGERDWYYEMPGHLLLVHEIKFSHGGHFRTDQIKIPWRKIAASLKRAYKPRKRTRKARTPI